jgi:hypothetical protein
MVISPGWRLYVENYVFGTEITQSCETQLSLLLSSYHKGSHFEKVLGQTLEI